MKITRPFTANIQDLNHKRFIEDVYKLINRNISFGQQPQYVDNVPVQPSNDQNIDGVMVEVSDTGNSTFGPFTVTHNLGRIPLYFDVKYNDSAGIVYDSGTPWTVTTASFFCSIAHAHVRLFIH